MIFALRFGFVNNNICIILLLRWPKVRRTIIYIKVSDSNDKSTSWLIYKTGKLFSKNYWMTFFRYHDLLQLELYPNNIIYITNINLHEKILKQLYAVPHIAISTKWIGLSKPRVTKPISFKIRGIYVIVEGLQI